MESVLSTENEIPLDLFFQEYFNCRKNKRNKVSLLEFEWEYPKKLYQLYVDINTFNYNIGTSTCFLVFQPKLREVFAASFRDRVVHHIVINRLEKLIESKFIDDSYNCRKGKGVQYGVNRLYEQIKEASNNYTKTVYIVKNDLKGFFMSIDRLLLCDKLKTLITNEYFEKDKEVLLYLVEKIVLHSPEGNCILHGDSRHWDELPKDKSLFTCGEGKGLPIGNLTSLIFANFYMSEFDHLMQNKYKYYGRYVDDFFTICDTMEEAKLVTDFAADWLEKNLLLTLSRNKVYILPYYHGVKFTGAVVKKSRIYTGSRTIGLFYNRITYINSHTRLTKDKICNYLNSYMGFLHLGRSYNLRRDIITHIDDRVMNCITFYKDYTKVLTDNIISRRKERDLNRLYKKRRRKYYKLKYKKKHEFSRKNTGSRLSKTLDS